MKLFSKLCNGWQEIADVSPDLRNENIHTLMLFGEQRCNVECISETITSTAFTLKLKTNEIEFKRESDPRPVKGLLCYIAILIPYTTDSGPEYKIKIHCQINENHTEFIMTYNCIIFDDDVLCPENPEELVTQICATNNEITSEADEEVNASIITPAQIQLTNLMKTLETNKKLITSSSITSILINKIHLNLTRRGLCQPRVKEIRCLLESGTLEYKDIILIVTKHPTIADNTDLFRKCTAFTLHNGIWITDDCFKTKAFVCEALLTDLNPTSAPSATNCTEGYKFFQHSCYGIDQNYKNNWTMAESNCANQRGHLASFHTREETEFIASLNAMTLTHLWTGLFYNNNVWQFSDGSKVDYLPWASNYPQSTASTAAYISADAIYNDQSSQKYFSVCKKAAI